MKRLTVCLMAAVLFSVPAASADAPVTTDGKLDFGLTDRTTQSDNDVDGAMTMLGETAGGGDTVQIPVTDRVLWVADQTTQVDFIIDAQTATAHLDIQPLLQDTDLTVRVGMWNASDGFTPAGEATQTVSGGAAVSIPVPLTTAQTFLETDEARPAMTITSSEILVQVNVNSDTALHYEQEPPPEPYPTPELGSLALSGLGLLSVVGLARFRREA